jgi:hypothetical protein
MNPNVLNLLIQILSVVIREASPPLLSSLRNSLTAFQLACLESPNAFDDVVAAAIDPIVKALPSGPVK